MILHNLYRCLSGAEKSSSPPHLYRTQFIVRKITRSQQTHHNIYSIIIGILQITSKGSGTHRNNLYLFKSYITFILINQGSFTMPLAYQEPATLENIAQYIPTAPVETVEPTEIVAKELPTIKLIYRGNTFDYTPPAAVEPENMDDWLTVILTYRGQQYTQKIKPLQPYEKPHATNWRWQYS
jgi:hypothetical protein